jgi:hypothetical protein
MLSNRTCKSFFHSFLFAHTKKKVNFQHEEIKIELEVTKSHLQSFFQSYSLFARPTKGGLPAKGNEDRARMLPNRTSKSFFHSFLFAHTTNKVDFQQTEMKKARKMLRNRTCRSFFQSLFTQQQQQQ